MMTRWQKAIWIAGLMILTVMVTDMVTETYAQQAPPTVEERVLRLERLFGDIKLSGNLRLRGVHLGNLDLDIGKAADINKDDKNNFFDARSYITMEVTKSHWKGVASLDVAGTNFNDGVPFGNDDPALEREFDVVVQYLYLQYTGLINATLGRQPTQIGHAIVSNITRDAIRVGKGFGPIELGAAWINGAEGVTQGCPTPTTVTPGAPDCPTIKTSERILNDSSAETDLDAVALVATYKPAPDLAVQAYWAKHYDASATNKFPDKLFVGASLDGTLADRLLYAAEGTYFGGTSAGAAGTTARKDNQASLIYLDGTYYLGGAAPAVAPGGGWKSQSNYLVHYLNRAAKHTASVGLAAGRGSGDNDPADDDQENFQNLFMNEVGFQYTYIYSDDVHGYDGRASDLARGSGFANTTWVQGHASWTTPIEKLAVGGSYTLLRATENQKKGGGPLGNPALTTGTTRDIGQELDAGLTYLLTSNTTVSAVGGVFWPGDIFVGDADRATKAELGVEFSF